MGRSFANGTRVGVYALNILAGGLVFQKWQLDGKGYDFSPGTYVLLNGSVTLTAIYGAAPLPPKVPFSLAIEGPSSVDEGSSTRYRARATYTDSSPAYVDAQAQWEVSSDYADISAGLLDASVVSSDRQVEIKATFTADGVTKTDTKSVTIRNTDAPTYTLTLSAQNGHITPSPNMRSYPAGTQVRLTAYPDEG